MHTRAPTTTITNPVPWAITDDHGTTPLTTATRARRRRCVHACNHWAHEEPRATEAGSARTQKRTRIRTHAGDREQTRHTSNNDTSDTRTDGHHRTPATARAGRPQPTHTEPRQPPRRNGRRRTPQGTATVVTADGTMTAVCGLVTVSTRAIAVGVGDSPRVVVWGGSLYYTK